MSAPFALGMTLWTAALLFFSPRLLRRMSLYRPNFRGENIPTAYGLFILLWLLPPFALRLLEAVDSAPLRAAAIAAAGYGLLGFLDDRWGDRRYSGLKGHIRALLSDRTVTTGLIKAIGGIAVGLGCAWVAEPGNIGDILMRGAIIALTANGFNLLDLRPGRAGAVFLLISTVVILAAPRIPEGLMLTLVPAVIAYVQDARARVMLGDTGSNLLGGALGLALTLAVTSLAGRLAILAILTGLHILSERTSLTLIIEKNTFLRRLDSLTGVR